jgi:predicted transposase/invertase (TIGR01784 family)
MIEVASLRYGVIFKKAFSRPNIFKAFVKDFLGLDLEIDQVETEKSFSPPIGAVDSRFDLFAEDKKNRIIVDIQHARLGDHYDRFLHYHCAALLEQIANAQNYQPSPGVFTIVILTAGDKHQIDLARIEFDPRSFSGEPLNEIPHKILYVCPKYVTDKTPEPYREWLLAIQDSLDQQVDETAYHKPEIQEIFRLIEKDNTTPQERARMKDEYAYNELYAEHYQQLIEQSRQEGRQEGREEGEVLLLRRLLTRRFGPLPDHRAAQLDTASQAQIEGWFDRAVDAARLDDVFRQD